jgi:iron complex outermembrane receptor protein
MSTLGLFDMQRVEILRGPQNSLFGRNTTGGAVNYISNLPQVGGGVTGYGLFTYGRHNLAEAEGGVTLPVGDKAALRLAGIYHSRDGIWNNLNTGDSSYGDEERYSGRATLVFEPGPNTRITVSAHSARDDSEAQPQKDAGALLNNPPLRVNDLAPLTQNIDWTNPTIARGLVNIEGFDNSTANWRDVHSGGAGIEKLNVDGGYIKIAQDFGFATLTSITAYDRTHALYEEDNTGDPVGAAGVDHDVLVIDMDQRYRQWSQELRLASDDNAASFRWIVGAYYFDEKDLLAQDIRFGENGFPGAHPSAAGITPPSLFDVIPNPYGNTVSFSIASLKDQSSSVYGQADWDFAPQWTFTLGLRYTHDHKQNPSYLAGAFSKAGADPTIYYDLGVLRERIAGLNLQPCTFGEGLSAPFQGNCATLDTPATDPAVRSPLNADEVGGKIGLQYHLTSDVMFYGSYSRGFKSGKFDMEFLHTQDTPFPRRPLTPETLDVFELGFKSTLFDHTLVFNGAVFYNIWKNQQVFNVGVNGPEFFNLPESHISGAEFEANWAPTSQWLITGSVGLLDTEMTDVTGIDFDVPLGQPGHGDFQKGHELALSPHVTATGAVQRTFDLSGGNSLVFALDGRYQGSSKVKYSPQVPIDEYDSRFDLNARATWLFGADQDYSLSLFGYNLTEEKYCNEIQDLRGVSGSFYCVPNDGEVQYGLQFRANF